jgi:hypothetical protein
VRLVIEGTIVIIVPFILSFMLNMLSLSLLASVFYPAACISAADDIAQVAVVPIMPSAALLRWSEAVGRVTVGTLLVVKLVTPGSVFVVVDRATVVATSSIASRRLTCALTSSLSLGKWG